MKRQIEIAQILLEILEEPITDKSINDIINSEDITDMGITSLNIVMFSSFRSHSSYPQKGIR